MFALKVYKKDGTSTGHVLGVSYSIKPENNDGSGLVLSVTGSEGSTYYMYGTDSPYIVSMDSGQTIENFSGFVRKKKSS